jgi:hypothetical protein
MRFTCHKFGRHHSERTEPVPSGLKARATLAWGNAPGNQHLTNPGPKARIDVACGHPAGHPHRTNCGPTARATIAWGEAPGHHRPNLGGLKAHAKRLVGNLCTATALLLPISAIPSLSQTQSQPIQIKVINAQTHKPIHDEQLNVALKVDQIGSVPMATDKHGIILVDPGDATTIRILANMYADCRPRAELYTNYSIATILKTGITTGNLCSGSATAKPGELILFEIPKTYIRTYPNPPATSLPHSDENPHSPPN